MDNKSEEQVTAFDETVFGKRAAEIAAEPDHPVTKEQLVEFWQLALEERTRHRPMQAYIALVAARTAGPFGGGVKLDFEIFEDDPYAKTILQFAYMDHMHEGYGEEANKEWDKLAAMLRTLPEYRDPDTSK